VTVNKTVRNSAISMMLLACVAPASAQETVGDLQKRGLKPMSAGELKAFLPGSTYIGPRAGGTGSGGGDPLELELGADGKANGKRSQTPMVGDWKVDDAGRFCYSVSPTVSRGARRPSEACVFLFKADDAYYRASDAADGAAPLIKVQFKR
jgi:hypothetical protein